MICDLGIPAPRFYCPATLIILNCKQYKLIITVTSNYGVRNYITNTELCYILVPCSLFLMRLDHQGRTTKLMFRASNIHDDKKAKLFRIFWRF